jgi:hypothetical protein
VPDRGARRAALLGTAVVLLVALGGCGSSSRESTARPRTTPVVAYPTAVRAGSIVLFDIDTKRLVAFDPVRKAVTATGNAPQTFQYPFPGRQDLLTSGSSNGYGFELLRVSGKEITRVVAVKGRRGLFPLASEGERTLLILQQYDAAGRPARQQIVRLDGSALVPVAHLGHSGITGGALVGGVLTYTVLRVRKGAGYDLRRVDLDDPASRPRTIRSGLRHGELGTLRGRLVVDLRVGAGGRARTLDCDGYCYFSESAGIVVAVAPNASNDRELRVIDPRSGRTRGSVVGAVLGFTIDRRAVDVYGDGLHERISLAR